MKRLCSKSTHKRSCSKFPDMEDLRSWIWRRLNTQTHSRFVYHRVYFIEQLPASLTIYLIQSISQPNKVSRLFYSNHYHLQFKDQSSWVLKQYLTIFIFTAAPRLVLGYFSLVSLLGKRFSVFTAAQQLVWSNYRSRGRDFAFLTVLTSNSEC